MRIAGNKTDCFQEFLQAALDIETLCPETRPEKRTSFELGIETIQRCSDQQQTQTTTTPATSTDGQLSGDTDQHVGRVLCDDTGPLRLNRTVEDGKLREVSLCRAVSGGGHGSSAQHLRNEATCGGSHLSRAYQMNCSTHSTTVTLAYDDSCKTLQNNLFSISDLCSDPDLSVGSGPSPGRKCGPKGTVSSSYDRSQLRSGSPSAEISHITPDTGRKTSLGARCLQLLRAEDQKQSPLPRQTIPTQMSHEADIGRAEIVGQVPAPVKKTLVLTEAVHTSHEAAGKEGPACPGSHSLKTTKKRKFPGPAGKLPQLVSLALVNHLLTTLTLKCIYLMYLIITDLFNIA